MATRNLNNSPLGYTEGGKLRINTEGGPELYHQRKAYIGPVYVRPYCSSPVLFAAKYNPCIYESEYMTLSLHLTKAGAEKAIKDDKAQRYGFNESDKACAEEFGMVYKPRVQQDFELYCIEPVTILP